MTSAAETVGDIGERALLTRLQPWIVSGRQGEIYGVGDDCAVLSSPGNGQQLILTSDLLLEDTHFLNNAKTNWQWLGRKAMAANISDIAAMGGEPTGVLISLGLPAEMPVDNVLSLYRGFHEMAKKFNAPIIGGDTARAPIVTISVTVLGRKSADAAGCFRSDARPGDFLYVSGPLGNSRAGLELILHPEQYTGLPLSLKDDLIEAHFSPTPQVPLGKALAETFDRVALIDISDGLYNEAGLIAEASSAGLSIELNSIPVHANASAFCQKQDINPQEFALFSGEEYALLFSLAATPEELTHTLRNRYNLPAPACVGRVTEGAHVTIISNGRAVNLGIHTFTHFGLSTS